MPPEIQRLTNQFLHNPVEIKAQALSSTAETITQRAVYAPSDETSKRDTLRDLMRDHANDIKNGIIFANRKTTVAVLEKSLQKHGFSCGALHGDMDQRSRLKMLDAFRNNNITYLIASDVAARGLDIPDVSHIYNYDVPTHSEDYVHRIGRTGRAGRLGNSYTLVKWEEFRALRDIENLIKKTVDWDGEAPTDEEIAESISSKGRRRRGSKSAEPKARPAATKAKSEKVEEKPPVVEKQERVPVEAKQEKRHSEEKPQRERSDNRRGRGSRGRENDYDNTPSMFTEENMPAFLTRPAI